MFGSLEHFDRIVAELWRLLGLPLLSAVAISLLVAPLVPISETKAGNSGTAAVTTLVSEKTSKSKSASPQEPSEPGAIPLPELTQKSASPEIASDLWLGLITFLNKLGGEFLADPLGSTSQASIFLALATLVTVFLLDALVRLWGAIAQGIGEQFQTWCRRDSTSPSFGSAWLLPAPRVNRPELIKVLKEPGDLQTRERDSAEIEAIIDDRIRTMVVLDQHASDMSIFQNKRAARTNALDAQQAYAVYGSAYLLSIPCFAIASAVFSFSFLSLLLYAVAFVLAWMLARSSHKEIAEILADLYALEYDTSQELLRVNGLPADTPDPTMDEETDPKES